MNIIICDTKRKSLVSKQLKLDIYIMQLISRGVEIHYSAQ